MKEFIKKINKETNNLVKDLERCPWCFGFWMPGSTALLCSYCCVQYEHNVRVVGVEFSESIVNMNSFKNSQMSRSDVWHVRPVVKAGRVGGGV